MRLAFKEDDKIAMVVRRTEAKLTANRTFIGCPNLT